MDYNKDTEFVGIEKMKSLQAKTLADFVRWSSSGNWQAIHDSHYDWWMFPIPRPSGHRLKYTVYNGDIADLKQDAAYMQSYIRGHELLSLAWGWKLYDKAFVSPEKAGRGQKWSNWPIRLNKAAHSAREFDLQDILKSHCAHARILIDRGEHMWFHDIDVARWFRENGA